MTLRDRNWRKGLFRLWLFLSVLWIVAVGVLGLYPATSRHIESVKAAHELQSLRASINYTFLDKNPGSKIDLESERKTGKSDERIAKELGAVRGYDVADAVAKGRSYADILNELSKISLPGVRYEVEESQTGVTIIFVWYEAQPPNQKDLDDVFGVALTLPSHTTDLDDLVAELRTKIKPPPSMPPGFVLETPTDRPKAVKAAIMSGRKQKLSESEAILDSKLNRIIDLQAISDSRKTRKQDFLFSLETTFLPPIAVLILGLCLRWVLSGFAPRQKG